MKQALKRNKKTSLSTGASSVRDTFFFHLLGITKDKKIKDTNQ